MALIINKEKVNNALIIEEINRLRPDYQKVFHDQTPEEQEVQLLEWAKENVVERVLLQQVALKNPAGIPKTKSQLKKSHGGDKKFHDSFGLSREDDLRIKAELELQFRVERLIQEITGEIEKPGEEQAKSYSNDHREKIINRLDEESRNKKIEEFVDSLKENATISFTVDETFKEEIKRNRPDKAPSRHYQKRLHSILIKPAGPDCNMACTYCFYLEKGSMFPETAVHRMKEEILEETIRQLMSQAGEHVSIGWQGGEPTLMGLPFFRKVVEFQKRYGRNQTVGNGLQTNGLLLNEKWAHFLKENKFLVGLSLDGPKHVHDHYRKTKGGGGTWERVMKSAKLLLNEGTAVNAVSLVTDYSVRFPEEIYNFHKNLGLTFMQFIPCVETDPENPANAAPFSVADDEYGKFLCTLFDLWKADFVDGKPTTSIRFFDSVFSTYVGFESPECTLLKECGIYVVVEHNGDVYACDFFVEPYWKLGSIMDEKLIDLLNSDKQMEFGRMKAELPALCESCKWLIHCRGGCTKDRTRDPRDKKLNHFCESYKMFFEHADDFLKKLAESWKEEQVRFARRDSVLAAIRWEGIRVGRNDPCPCGSKKKFKVCCGSDE
jgi:uncharacterized protein